MSSLSLTASLKQAGLRLTPQRVAICQFLLESKDHPTAVMIYEHLRSRYPSLSPMTVYNTLKALVELGQVNALGHAGDNTVHYDANISPHLHLACIRCHRIVDVPCDCLSGLDETVRRTSGYQLLGACLMFYGLCPTCQPSGVS
jgi:Fur family peroxide stress response transcriptional regulator